MIRFFATLLCALSIAFPAFSSAEEDLSNRKSSPERTDTDAILDDFLAEFFGTLQTQAPPALPFVSPSARAPSTQSLNTFSSLFAPHVSAKDMDWITQTISQANEIKAATLEHMRDPSSTLSVPGVSAVDMDWMKKMAADASTIQSYTRQQMMFPGSAPSPAFFGLPDIQRQGAQQAVDFLQQFMRPVPSQEACSSPLRRPSTPPRDMDASYEVLSGTVLDTIQKWYFAKERVFSGEADLQDLLPTLGALGIDGLILANDLLDTATFGAFGAVSDLLDQGAQIVRTNLRRGVRDLSESALLGQEVGDYTYVVLSTVGGKGLKHLRHIKIFKTRDGKILGSSVLKELHPQRPYESTVIRRTLEESHPMHSVSSSTLPASNARGVKHANQRHPESDIVYDERGLPNFIDHAKYDVQLPKESFFPQEGSGKTLRDLSAKHMRLATQTLKADIQAGRVRHAFTPEQLSAIYAAKAKIPDHTWHHDPRSGRLMLLESQKHKETEHVGSISLYGKKEKK